MDCTIANVFESSDVNVENCSEVTTATASCNHNATPPSTATVAIARRVAYVTSDKYLQHCDQLPRVSGRASIVHQLIEAYGLLNHMSIVSPSAAELGDLRLFHSAEYIDCLQSASERNDDEKSVDGLEEFGLAYDCPVFPDLFDCVKFVAGGTITAANCLLSQTADIAINWSGGWHHAKRDEAAGFCYINDAVLGILKLREKFTRVLYVDLDLHHGDGVEDAFCATGKVLTISFHKYSPGFFPGSGSLTDIGIGKGKYYAVNVPLKDGVDDNQFVYVFNRVMSAARDQFRPDAVVCQCGADTLAGDPHACFNLTPYAISQCLQHLMAFNVPLLLLGGGGYNFCNTARCWAVLTASLLGISLPSEIPENEYFTLYGPGFELNVTPSFMRNTNTTKELEDVISTVLGNLAHLNHSN